MAVKRRIPAAVALLLALLAIAALGGVAGNGFLSFDDGAYITANRHVRSGLSWEGVRWAFTTTTHGNWHPLTWLSHMADASLFGMRPGAHHLVSLALHVASTLLLFLTLRTMTGALWRSAFAAALFAVHPLHVESVGWAAERKDVLSGLFWMLTLVFWARSLRRPGSRYGALATASFVLGLLAKPMLVTLPFALLLLDYWPLGRSRSLIPPAPLWREKAHLLLLSAAGCVIALVSQRQAGAMASGLAVPWASRVENALVSYTRYLGKLAWPSDLAAYYPLDIDAWHGIALLGAAAAPLLLTLLALIAARRRPWAATGWLWFVGTLLPVIGLVQVGDQALADRYTYLPSVGIFVTIVWGASDLAGRRRAVQVLLAALAIAWIGALVPLARRQVSFWRDDLTLFGHALSVTERNWMMENNMGVALAARGDLAGAVQRYQKSLAASPHPLALLNLGAALAAQGRAREAEGYLREAVRLAPRDAEAHYNLAVTLASLGRTKEALAAYREAIRLDAGHADARYNAGLILAEEGSLDEAERLYREALRIAPRLAEAHNALGAAAAARGRMAEAAEQFAEALRIRPGYAEAEANLRLARSLAGRQPAGGGLSR